MSYQDDVDIFMDIGGQYVECNIASKLDVNDPQTKLYMNLITEEYQETLEAFKNGDLIEVADGLADMVWVIMGLASTVGIPFDAVWDEVKASNMSKFPDGKCIKNEDGKIMKPNTYFRPNIAEVLDEMRGNQL